MQNLSFATLRQANTLRLPLFKNSRGLPAHLIPDGSDWSLGEWTNAILGELGEAANLVKKVKRGDVTLEAARDELAREFADVVTYADIAAMQMKCSLGYFASFGELHDYMSNSSVTSFPNDRSLGEIMNVAFASFGWIASIVDLQRNRVEALNGNPSIINSFDKAMMALDCAAHYIDRNLGHEVAKKFNIISLRVGANVYITDDNNITDDVKANLVRG